MEVEYNSTVPVGKNQKFSCGNSEDGRAFVFEFRHKTDFDDFAEEKLDVDGEVRVSDLPTIPSKFRKAVVMYSNGFAVDRMSCATIIEMLEFAVYCGIFWPDVISANDIMNAFDEFPDIDWYCEHPRITEILAGVMCMDWIYDAIDINLIDPCSVDILDTSTREMSAERLDIFKNVSTLKFEFTQSFNTDSYMTVISSMNCLRNLHIFTSGKQRFKTVLHLPALSAITNLTFVDIALQCEPSSFSKYVSLEKLTMIRVEIVDEGLNISDIHTLSELTLSGLYGNVKSIEFGYLPALKELKLPNKIRVIGLTYENVPKLGVLTMTLKLDRDFPRLIGTSEPMTVLKFIDPNSSIYLIKLMLKLPYRSPLDPPYGFYSDVVFPTIVKYEAGEGSDTREREGEGEGEGEGDGEGDGEGEGEGSEASYCLGIASASEYYIPIGTFVSTETVFIEHHDAHTSGTSLIYSIDDSMRLEICLF